MDDDEEIIDDDEQETAPGETTKLVNPDDEPTKRGVTALHLMMMIYFFTSGGPFGIEPAIGAAGPLLTLFSIVIIPLFWALPQALMAAELALMMSENGGNVLWAQRAFGDFVGWWNAYANLVCSFSSLSLLAVLFVDYLPHANTFPVWESYLLKLAFIVVITVLNIVGLKFISRLNVLFLILILSPFLGMVVLLCLRYDNYFWNFKALGEIPPFKEVQWGLFISTVIWSYGGFDSIGSLAGEVKGGRKTYILGITGAMPLIIANYFFPILIGYSVDDNRNHWVSGYFTTIATLFSNWMSIWTVIASALSNFGQYNAAMAPLARVVWAMAKGKAGGKKLLPGIIGFSWRRHTGTVRPVGAVIFVGALSACMAALPFNFLVQIFLIVRVVNLFFEYGALIKLRFTDPDAERPFQVPGGIVGACLLPVPSVILAVFCLAYADWGVWLVGMFAHAVIIMGFLLKRAYEKAFVERVPSQISTVN